MTPRTEVLICPTTLTGGARSRVLATALTATIPGARVHRFTCGDHEAFVLADGLGGGVGAIARGGRYVLTEGAWPEPLGLRVSLPARDAPGQGWDVVSDRLGARPIYYGSAGSHGPVVSTRPDVVAALLGAAVSVRALAEQLLIGFTLDDHSPWVGVHRLRPGARLVCDGVRSCRLEEATFDAPAHAESSGPAAPTHIGRFWVDPIATRVAEAFDAGFALELSGGVDSRLVLAMGLSRGVKPTLAFTLGAPDDEDVRLAQEICARERIEHVVVPTVPDETRLADDGRTFLRRAGFAINASSYAWLPAALDRLAPRRTGQIGGGGGECATGFYDSPLDALVHGADMRRAWVRKRLFRPGVDLDTLFGRDRARTLRRATMATALGVLDATPGSWRQRCDAFYRTQRVPNAGGAVLSASACWYEPLQPLLHREHIDWAERLAPRDRRGRRAQLRILSSLRPGLADVPFSHGRRATAGRGAAFVQACRTARRQAAKLGRRLNDRPAAPDLGAAAAARALACDVDVQAALWSRGCRGATGLRGRAIEDLIADAVTHPHEIGALITTAWAARSAATVARELARADAAARPAAEVRARAA